MCSALKWTIHGMESNGMSEWELLEKFFAYSTCDYVNNIDEERERAQLQILRSVTTMTTISELRPLSINQSKILKCFSLSLSLFRLDQIVLSLLLLPQLRLQLLRCLPILPLFRSLSITVQKTRKNRLEIGIEHNSNIPCKDHGRTITTR